MRACAALIPSLQARCRSSHHCAGEGAVASWGAVRGRRAVGHRGVSFARAGLLAWGSRTPRVERPHASGAGAAPSAAAARTRSRTAPTLHCTGCDCWIASRCKSRARTSARTCRRVAALALELARLRARLLLVHQDLQHLVQLRPRRATTSSNHCANATQGVSRTMCDACAWAGPPPATEPASCTEPSGRRAPRPGDARTRRARTLNMPCTTLSRVRTLTVRACRSCSPTTRM